MTDLSLVLTPLTPADMPHVEKLDERAFGPGRFARTAYRPARGRRAGFLAVFRRARRHVSRRRHRMTRIKCGGVDGLLLGPLTVDPSFRSRGIGAALANKSLEAAAQSQAGIVLLVGDAPYYARLGFKPVPMGRLVLPGPVDPHRLLYRELRDGALDAAKGAVTQVR
jgi:predicted N-acetyltransferase YhbS